MQHSTDPRGHDNAVEIERGAYNRAFSELGLEWYWDARTYESLKPAPATSTASRPTSRAHQPHLLQAYDSGFLADADRERAAPPERSRAH